MTQRLSLQKVIELRHDYFSYIYKEYIQNDLTKLNESKNEQMI